MNLATIQVSGVHANVVRMCGRIPAGIVGATVELRYDGDVWAGLRKTVVFKGRVTKDVISDSGTVTVPAEVVAETGCRLRVGIYGTDADNNIVVPTLWADLGTVSAAADPSGDTTTDPALPVWAQLQAAIGNLNNLDTQAKSSIVAAINELAAKGGDVDPAAVQQIVIDYLVAHPPTVTETDPTVPAWAKDPQKPSYTAEEVGALPNTYTPPNQTAEQVGADPKGTAASVVSQHNTADDSHNDIRLELKAINDRLTAFFDSDDTTLDELSEIVAYITSNKTLIESITTSKVSVADIVNNLTSNVSNKPLSAAQGVVLKGLIDTLSGNLANYQLKGDYALRSELPSVPTKVSAFTNDSGYQTAAQVATTVNEAIENIEFPSSGVDVTGATVGQTIKVSAVDDTGKPTAWEAVDFPSGGGGGETEEVFSQTITEEVQYIYHDIDWDKYQYVMVYIHQSGADSLYVGMSNNADYAINSWSITSWVDILLIPIDDSHTFVAANTNYSNAVKAQTCVHVLKDTTRTGLRLYLGNKWQNGDTVSCLGVLK